MSAELHCGCPAGVGSDPLSSGPADWPLVAPRYHITREISLLAPPEVYTSVSLLRPSVSPRDRTHCSLRRAWAVLGGPPKTRLKHVGMGACSGYTLCMTVSACHCRVALDISLSLSGPRRTEVGRSRGEGRRCLALVCTGARGLSKVNRSLASRWRALPAF